MGKTKETVHKTGGNNQISKKNTGRHLHIYRAKSSLWSYSVKLFANMRIIGFQTIAFS
jgi:hypothetical protein